MAYLGSWKIDDLLTFVHTTNVYATGAAADADSVPTYRIYEDETGTAILTGSMALLDGSNTTGFYSEQVTLSAANGFELTKSYSVYIEATVSTVVLTTCHTFQIEAAVDVRHAAGVAWTSGAITAASVATDVQTKLRAIVTGTSDSGSTTTMVDSARTEADTDYWKYNFILFTSGNIAGQCRLITNFAPASDTITFAGPTTQAVSTQTYEILPAGEISLRMWLGSTANALVSGRVSSLMAAVSNDVITAASLAADVTTELQAGLATSSALATVQADTDDIQTTLAGLATSAALATVQADTDNIQTRLPAALVGGRMDSSVGAWSLVIEGAYTIVDALRIILASVSGKLSGAATTTVKIRDSADTKDRITATVDGNGNRTAVTLDVS